MGGWGGGGKKGIGYLWPYSPIQETVIVIKQTNNNVAMHHEKADEALQN